jgi:hypothetical protein
MKTLSVTHRPDGAAVVIFDAPGSSVNVISEAVLRELQDVMSAKRPDFIAGADSFAKGPEREPVL